MNLEELLKEDYQRLQDAVVEKWPTWPDPAASLLAVELGRSIEKDPRPDFPRRALGFLCAPPFVLGE